MPAAPGGGFRRGFAAMRHRNYRLYWSSARSQPGRHLDAVGQPAVARARCWAARRSSSGIVLALQFAPAMVLAPLGGVLADRVDKRKALRRHPVDGHGRRPAVLFGLTLTGVVQIWHI